MKKIVCLIFLVVGLLTNIILFAQQDLTLYNMEVVPQRMYSNPAFIPAFSKINIGLPMFSSQYLNISNSGFKYSDLIKHRFDDSLYVDYDNMLSKLSKNNYLSVAYQPDLLSFGFSIKKNYISFNATEKINFRFRYPKDFMSFLWKGNGSLLDKELNLNFGIDFIHYREYALGFARQINDKLLFGIKVKYLYGMENIWTEKADVTLNTDPNSFDITAKSNVILHTSGFDENSFNNFNVNNYAFKKKNTGWGIDLGGVYKLNKKITLSASVIDLGFIKWNEGNTSYQSHDANGKFIYQGFEMNQFITKDSSNTNNAGQILLDSLSKNFQIDTNYVSYKTKLSTQIYFGANYNYCDKGNMGILFYSQIFDRTIHPAVSLSVNQRVGRWLNVSASYSIYNRSFNNFGLGLALNGGPIQLYIVSDNFLGALFPQNAKNIHLRAGINLTFGRSEIDSDKDGIENKKDECPNVAGSKELNGCPDKDFDKVADKNDLCPDVFGLVQFKGCPDYDGDGVSDKDDACPEHAGLVASKGCPDYDGDKIPDKDDACPDEPGNEKMKGCPDTDGDGIVDDKDKCPTKAGLPANNGCPEVKLFILDSAGRVIKTIIQNKDGSFTFDHLPEDKNYIFKLQGEGVDSITILNIVFNGVLRKANKTGAGKFFKFTDLDSDVHKLKSEQENDVSIKLDIKEAEIVKKAFNNLEFDQTKDIIKAESYASLDELAGLMMKKPLWRIKISGHTDNQGTQVTNMKLSQKRVEAVRKYLKDKGLTDSRFKLEWFGQEKPIADNKTEEGRQKNRRVEMLIIE